MLPIDIPALMWSPKWSDTKRWFPISTTAPPAYVHSAKGAARVVRDADEFVDDGIAHVSDTGPRLEFEHESGDDTGGFDMNDNDSPRDDGLAGRLADCSPEHGGPSERMDTFCTAGSADLFSTSNDHNSVLPPARAIALAFTAMADGLLDMSAHDLQLALPDLVRDMSTYGRWHNVRPVKGGTATVPLIGIRGLNRQFTVGLGVYTREECIVRALCRHPEVFSGTNWRCFYQSVSSYNPSVEPVVEPITLLTEAQRAAVDSIVTSAVWHYGIALGLQRGVCWPDGIPARVRQRVLSSTMTHREASIRLVLHYESVGESWQDVVTVQTHGASGGDTSNRIPAASPRVLSFGLSRAQPSARGCKPSGYKFHPLMFNPGFHCFIHGVLHLLCASIRFRTAFICDDGPQPGGRITDPLRRLLAAMHADQGENELSLHLKAFKSSLPYRYSGSRQEDAGAFVMFLLDALDEELRGSPPVAGSAADSIVASAELSWGRHFQDSASTLGPAVCLQLRVDRACHLRRCDSISIGHEHPMCLQLALTDCGSVAGCLDRYFATVTDYNTDVEQCRMGKKHVGRTTLTGADISTSITRYPRILLLVLKRWRQDDSGAFIKDTRPVQASVCLSLQRFHSTGSSEGCQFKLVSCCSHSGSTLSSGHYTASVLLPNADASAADQWLHMNDSHAAVEQAHSLIRCVPVEPGFQLAVLLYEQQAL